MKNLFKKIKQVSILILAISFIGCEDDDAVLPKLTAGFTHTIDADTGTVTFINTSVNASSYAWDFGDESTSTLINPVNVYADGTYTIVLVASNVAGAIGGTLDPINGMYWAWNSGYVNFKIEGTSTLSNARKNAFKFHLGGYQHPYNSYRAVLIKIDDFL